MTIEFKGKFSPINALNVVAWVNTHLTDITVAEDGKRIPIATTIVIKLDTQAIEIYSTEKENK